MYQYFAIALGGALGAISRYWLTTTAEAWSNGEFPVGTFLVNILGSFLVGVAFVLLAERTELVAAWRPLIVVGFLGAMTTFSTFSLEGVLLLQQGHYNTALLYLLGSVVLCLLAAFGGMQLTRLLF